MNTLLIGIVVFACCAGGSALGMVIGAALPRQHLSADSKDAIKVAIAVVATLSALVVGLLISSAKTSFDSKDRQVKQAAAHIIQLDRTMKQYGPETAPARERLRQIVSRVLAAVWPDQDQGPIDMEKILTGQGTTDIQTALLKLTPENDAQRWLQQTALQLCNQIEQVRLNVIEQQESGIRWPFVVILVFWFVIIFFSFGLFAPRNRMVAGMLGVCALSVAGALYLIVQMDRPFSGLIEISGKPLQIALDQIGK
jgi:hypothetical protein